MKYLILFLCLFSTLLPAQPPTCDYAKLLREGKDFAKQRQYKKALYKYNSARRCNPDKGEEINAVIEALLDQVEGEKRAADKALADLRATSGQVVQSLVHEAESHIYHLRYAEALEKLNAAAEIGQKKAEVARALMEVAFFYAESNRFPEAQGITALAGRLFDKNTTLLSFDTSDAPASRQAFKQTLNGFDPARYAEIEARYYPVMIDVKGGAFTLGCESGGDCDSSPRVELPDFQVAKTETTFWQFALFAAATGQNIQDFSPDWGLDGDNPAVNVSWFQAVEYANWLSERLNYRPAYHINTRQNDPYEDQFSYYFRDKMVRAIPNADGFCLPRDAEWEYAARGGAKSDKYVYDETDTVVLMESVGDSLVAKENNTLAPVAWYTVNSDTSGVKRTHPVATRLPNSLGFFDMKGNVWEWCWDVFDENQEITPESPDDPPPGNTCNVRGGAWASDDLHCRLTLRLQPTGGRGTFDIGFRLVKY